MLETSSEFCGVGSYVTSHDLDQENLREQHAFQEIAMTDLKLNMGAWKTMVLFLLFGFLYVLHILSHLPFG